MLIETILAAMIVGFVSGGNFKNLGNTHIRYINLVFISVLVRHLPSLMNFGILENYSVWKAVIAPLFFNFSYFIIILVLIMNIEHITLNLVLAGSVMNFIVVIANGGYMPVSEVALERGGYNFVGVAGEFLDMNHIISSESTIFYSLGDIILIPPPYPFPQILSIGDIAMCIGIFLFIIINMIKKKTVHQFRYYAGASEL